MGNILEKSAEIEARAHFGYLKAQILKKNNLLYTVDLLKIKTMYYKTNINSKSKKEVNRCAKNMSVRLKNISDDLASIRESKILGKNKPVFEVGPEEIVKNFSNDFLELMTDETSKNLESLLSVKHRMGELKKQLEVKKKILEENQKKIQFLCGSNLKPPNSIHIKSKKSGNSDLVSHTTNESFHRKNVSSGFKSDLENFLEPEKNETFENLRKSQSLLKLSDNALNLYSKLQLKEKLRNLISKSKIEIQERIQNQQKKKRELEEMIKKNKEFAYAEIKEEIQSLKRKAKKTSKTPYKINKFFIDDCEEQIEGKKLSKSFEIPSLDHY